MPPQVATYGTLLSVHTALNSEIPINSLFTSHQTIRPSGIALGVHQPPTFHLAIVLWCARMVLMDVVVENIFEPTNESQGMCIVCIACADSKRWHSQAKYLPSIEVSTEKVLKNIIEQLEKHL